MRAKKPLGLRAPLTPFAPTMEPAPKPSKPAPPSSVRAAERPASQPPPSGPVARREVTAAPSPEPVPPPPAAIAALADMPFPTPTSGIRLAERAPSNDAVPPSERDTRHDGVRNDVAAVAQDDELHGPLSFRVYTLEELDRRRPDADPALRMSRVMFEAAPRQPSPWHTFADRARVFGAAFVAWARAWMRTKQRPATDDVRVPFELAREALVLALRTVDWRRVSFYGGASIATLMVLLGVVLTVADLTDDMKPRSARHPDLRSTLATSDVETVRATGSTTKTSSSLTSPIANAAAKTAEMAAVADVRGAAVTVVEAPADSEIELDDNVPPSPPTVAQRTPLKPRRAAPLGNTGGRTKASKSGRLGFRDADEIWKP